MNPLTGRNRIVAEFYEGPSWQRFRPWERLFLAVQGGQKRARWPILRRLTVGDTARVLEVGIGDGDNLALLPPTWEIQGVDLARSRLTDCLRRFPKQAGRLTLAEAERLPFPDATFDACYSVGGFTFFGDHEGALREMRRVTRPGGPVVVADEVPWLCRMGIGHLIGRPEIDAFWMRGLGLNREFLAMVFELQLDLDEIVGSALPGARRMAIWGGLGYCIVHP
jgi:SAM-dependent methyltransferase